MVLVKVKINRHICGQERSGKVERSLSKSLQAEANGFIIILMTMRRYVADVARTGDESNDSAVR